MATKTKNTLAGKATPEQIAALGQATGQSVTTQVGGSSNQIKNAPKQQFVTPDLSGLNNGATATRAPSAIADSGHYSPYATGDYGGIPQSYVDEVVQQLNTKGAVQVGGATYSVAGATAPEPDVVKNIVQKAWNTLPIPEQQRYKAADAEHLSAANNAVTQKNAEGIIAGIPGQEANAINGFYNQYVTPGLTRQTQAVAAQAAADRTAEGQVAGLTDNYARTIQGNQDARMGNIASTNQYDTNAINYLAGETTAANTRANDLYSGYNTQLQGANAQQTGLYNTLAGQNNAINASQTGMYNTLAGQAAGINANQTGLFNTLSGQAAASNAQQSAGNSKFQGQIGQLNSQEQAYLATFTQQLAGLNDADRANYMNYLQETNPQMAQLIATASDPELVGNQKDVLNRYKELSTPQVTAQERLIASLARQKFESDDRSNREGVMQQLAGRGLKSGGLVIAGQQAEQERLAQDRMNAELGLQANAVSRGMEGLAGYGQQSNVLRNADDAMKQFSDQYRQNEAQRVSQLALQRNQSGYQETAAETGRAGMQWDASSQSVRDEFGRDQAGYNANTETVNNNYARDQSVFDAGTVTNRDNYGRDESVFNAGTTTNNNNTLRNQNTYTAGTQTVNDNTARNTLGYNAGTSTNDTNYNRTAGLVGAGIGVNDANSTRYQTGLTAGDTTAGNVLSTGAASAMYPTQNRATELASATTAANTGLTAGTNFSGVQSGLSADAAAALEKILKGRSFATATTAAGQV